MSKHRLLIILGVALALSNVSPAQSTTGDYLLVLMEKETSCAVVQKQLAAIPGIVNCDLGGRDRIFKLILEGNSPGKVVGRVASQPGVKAVSLLGAKAVNQPRKR